MENLVRLNSRNLYYVSIARKCFRTYSVDLAHHIRLNESYKDVLKFCLCLELLRQLRFSCCIKIYKIDFVYNYKTTYRSKY